MTIDKLLAELDTLLTSEGYLQSKLEWQRLKTKHEEQLTDLKSRQRLERLRFEIDKSPQYVEWRRVKSLSEQIESLLYDRQSGVTSDNDEAQMVQLLADVHSHLVELLKGVGGR